MKKETVLIIDGDVLAFRMSAAIDKRSVLVTHTPTGKQKLFDTKTEFRDRLKEKGTSEKEVEYTFEPLIESADVSHCLHNIKTKIEKLKEMVEPDRVEIYISGDTNFRLNLELPTKYKSNREGLYRPVYLKEAKEYLLTYKDAIKSYEIEADDLVSIRAYEEINKGNKAIISSNDKDTLQGNGVGFLDWTVEEPQILWIPSNGSGHIEHTGKKVVGYGMKFLAYQLLVGDVVDCYKPTELSTFRYGAKTAVKDLTPLQTTQEVFDFVIKSYKKFYPESFEYTAWDGRVIKSDWDHMLSLYFACSYMRRSWDDVSNYKEFFKSQGWTE